MRFGCPGKLKQARFVVSIVLKEAPNHSHIRTCRHCICRCTFFDAKKKIGPEFGKFGSPMGPPTVQKPPPLPTLLFPACRTTDHTIPHTLS